MLKPTQGKLLPITNSQVCYTKLGKAITLFVLVSDDVGCILLIRMQLTVVLALKTPGSHSDKREIDNGQEQDQGDTSSDHEFSAEQEQLFQTRFEEGYDLMDPEYLCWLKVNHPDSVSVYENTPISVPKSFDGGIDDDTSLTDTFSYVQPLTPTSTTEQSPITKSDLIVATSTASETAQVTYSASKAGKSPPITTPSM